jgi:hypothetical protein
MNRAGVAPRAGMRRQFTGVVPAHAGASDRLHISGAVRCWCYLRPDAHRLEATAARSTRTMRGELTAGRCYAAALDGGGWWRRNRARSGRMSGRPGGPPRPANRAPQPADLDRRVVHLRPDRRHLPVDGHGRTHGAAWTTGRLARLPDGTAPRCWHSTDYARCCPGDAPGGRSQLCAIAGRPATGPRARRRQALCRPRRRASPVAPSASVPPSRRSARTGSSAPYGRPRC